MTVTMVSYMGITIIAELYRPKLTHACLLYINA